MSRLAVHWKNITGEFDRHMLVGKRTPKQALLITALLTALYTAAERTHNEVKISQSTRGATELISYRSKHLTLTFIDGPTPDEFKEATYGLPFHEPEEYARRFYQYWLRSVETLWSHPYGPEEAELIVTLGILKRWLRKFEGLIVAVPRSDHGLAFMLHPLEEDGSNYRIDVNIW